MEDVLYHHGIKGQRWGVRRGPPYPLMKCTVSFAKSKAALVKAATDRYASGGPAGNQNCQLCTWAMESQFRGKNVLPRPVYSPRDVIFGMNGYDIVKNPIKISISDKNDVVQKVIDAGEGSRFYTHVNWKNSAGGHEFITMNIEQDVYVVDGQDGTVSKISSRDAETYFGDINYANSYLIRMDDKELNTDILKYNAPQYTTQWNWEKDIAYMKEQGMISDSEAEGALSLNHGKTDSKNSLSHHGIKGQRWGVRRFQNPDGTWTNAGKERYGDSDGETGSQVKTTSSNNKKVAVGIATGAAIVAGTVLTAYLVKKYGGKNISDIASQASAGKEIFQDILTSTPIATTPVSQIPAPKVEPKQVLEKAVKSSSATAASSRQFLTPAVSNVKPPFDYSNPTSFESLMKQNSDLLKKMYAELA